MNYTPEQQSLWNRVVGFFEEELATPSFKQWIKPMELFAVTANEVIVIFHDALSLQMMIHLYKSRVENKIKFFFGSNYTLKVLDAKEVSQYVSQLGHSTLNPNYTFENFIIGDSNKYAYMTSLAVAEQPSEVYNPFFIYGDVGLGKTHLLNAIGNYIKARNPMANVLFTSSENFANDLIDTFVKKSGTSELRNRLRSVDVLMIDDIQFLGKTNASQEEFFHTFNDLHENHKQIIICSDRPPHELPAIAERLRSRFAMGLTVDIQKPDFETRVAILRHKAEEEYIDIPYEVIEYIAEHFNSNIRDLEGALNSVNARSRHMNEPINMDLAVRALQPLIRNPSTRKVTPELIMEVVCRRYDVEQADMLSKKRNREIAVPRQIAIYICRELTEMSTTNIGKAFGGRDHTTVMHSCEKVSAQMKEDFAFRKKIEELIELVKNS